MSKMIKLNKLKDLDEQKKALDAERSKIARELNQLDDDVMYTVERNNQRMQQKVDNSDYLNDNRHSRKLQIIKDAAENSARLKDKQEVLLQDKETLNKNITVSDMVKRDHSAQPVKIRLLNVGNDILNTSVPNAAYGDDAKQSQDRINKLVQERQRTIRQLEHDSTFDEIDQLKFQVDNGYNTDGNLYRKGILDYTNNLRSDRELDPKEKAQRLANIRRGVSSREGRKSESNRVNYNAAKPIMDRQLDKLNRIIKNEKEKEIRGERLMINQNMNVGVPNYENKHNYSVLNTIGKNERIDFKQPLINHYKKVSLIFYNF